MSLDIKWGNKKREISNPICVLYVCWLVQYTATQGRLLHGQSSYWTAMSSFSFPTSDHTEAENLGPKLHPGGGFFGPWFL